MGKKQSSNIYESEQANKKHRKKSKKLEKREKHKKNKKKNKKEKSKRRKIEKYIKKGFKENKQDIDISKLFGECLDLDEILKQIKKILQLNSNAVGEVSELFKIMEENKKEVNIAGIEDKSTQKHILKLFKNLKITQSTRNPFCFRITNLGKLKDPKKKYTTDIEDVIADNLNEEEGNIEENENDSEQIDAQGNSSISDSEVSSNHEYSKKPLDKKKLKELNREKIEMDYEFELLEEKLGKNAELINKAFNQIMQEDNTNRNIHNDEDEQELVGPPVPKFLQATMNLINSNEDDKESFNKILTSNTYSKDKKTLPVTSQKSKIEPINKESYDRLINYERERMKYMADEIEDYESKYRNTSLLEEYQQMKKDKQNMDVFSKDQNFKKGFNRDRDMNIGRIDSKRALSIMRDNKGLQGRFEAKEKYIGY